MRMPRIAGPRVRKRFRTLLGDPVEWLERGIPMRRILLAVLMLLLLLEEDLLGSPLNPWFTAAMLAYIAFLLCMELVSRKDKGYHEQRWRAIRMPVHLAFAALVLGLSGSSSAAYLVFLPWVTVAAIYLQPGLALGTAVASAALAGAALWLGGQVSPSRLAVEISLIATGLLGATLFALYLWQQLQAEWRSRLQQLNALREVGSAITASTGMDQTFSRIFQLTGTLVHFEAALVLGRDPVTDCLQILGQSGYDLEFLRKFSFDPTDGLTGYVASSREPLLVADVRRRASVRPKYPEVGRGRPLRSFLATPLVVGDQLVGVYELTSDKVGAFGERDLEVLESLAPHIAIAVRNAKLQEQLQHQAEKAQHQYEEMQKLVDTSVTLALSGRDVRALLSTIVRRAAELLKARSGGILLSYPAERIVRMAFTHNLDPMEKFECGFGEAVCGHVGESGEPMIVNGYQASPHCPAALQVPPFSELLQAVIAVPLVWQKQTIGVLTVSDNDRDRQFGESDLVVLKRFAEQASLAIGNARLNSYREELIRISPDAIIRIDEEGRILEFNEAAERILDHPAREAIGRDVAELYYDGLPEARRVKVELERSGDAGVRRRPTTVRSLSGERIPIGFSGMILDDETGRQSGSFGIITDKRDEQGLRDSQKKSEFLAALEAYPHDRPISDQKDLRDWLSGQMKMAREFCEHGYLILFANLKESETVLPAIAWTGLPSEVEASLPHFNWGKAFTRGSDESDEDYLRREADQIAHWTMDDGWRERMVAVIRGSNARFFQNAVCAVPLRLADKYRSVLVIGPSAEQRATLCDGEFLRAVNLTIAMRALSWVQALYLRNRQKEAELANALIIHRTKVNLLRINGKLGLVKLNVNRPSPAFQAATEGEDLVADLARAVPSALGGNVLEVERGDYSFQRFSLAALVQNCVQELTRAAEERGRRFIIDPSVEWLPYASVDPTFMTIALGNLLDNALKYSFTDTYVEIRAESDQRSARVFIVDRGYSMPKAALRNLQEPGLRWRPSKPGTGLGLWEANRIVNNHGGSLSFASRPLRGKAHSVTVWIEIPLRNS